jgi:3-keto-L-gulonate-6-phosphate decarboxylase
MNTTEETAYEKQNRKIREAEQLVHKAIVEQYQLNKTQLRKVIWLQKQASKAVEYHMGRDTKMAHIWANRGYNAGKAIVFTVGANW